jgi:hypothetical protein
MLGRRLRNTRQGESGNGRRLGEGALHHR